MLTAGAYPDTKRIDGATPLWIAAQMGHDHICKVLLQNGANVDAVRCDGATPLFKAAHKGHAAVVTELLKHRPNLGLLPVKWKLSTVLRRLPKDFFFSFFSRMVKLLYMPPLCLVT